jgi:hypothetical protein
MTTDQYLKALKRLNLKPSSKLTAEALGVSLRQAQYYAAGARIPQPVALLLQCLLSRAPSAHE